ncbi:MAG: hypothetical protein U0326_40790 [Polyangiales bacterium]
MTSQTLPSTAIETINQLAVEATLELFDSFALPIAHTSSWAIPDFNAADEELVIASVGYTAVGLRGSLVMAVKATEVTAWEQVLLGRSGDAVLCDTVAEFTNMLVGRLKNKLIPRGVVLSFAIPTSSIGSRLRLFGLHAAASCWLRFDGDDRAVHVRVDTTVDDGFAMTEPSASDDAAPAAEGEMLFF